MTQPAGCVLYGALVEFVDACLLAHVCCVTCVFFIICVVTWLLQGSTSVQFYESSLDLCAYVEEVSLQNHTLVKSYTPH